MLSCVSVSEKFLCCLHFSHFRFSDECSLCPGLDGNYDGVSDDDEVLKALDLIKIELSNF